MRGRDREAAQHFGDAPRLRDTAARRIRRLGVEDLADRSGARIAQMDGVGLHEIVRGAAGGGVDLEPRVDIRTDEPRPDGALMVGGVAGAEVAVVLRLVRRVAGV
jgi:hypothetical protein